MYMSIIMLLFTMFTTCSQRGKILNSKYAHLHLSPHTGVSFFFLNVQLFCATLTNLEFIHKTGMEYHIFLFFFPLIIYFLVETKDVPGIFIQILKHNFVHLYDILNPWLSWKNWSMPTTHLLKTSFFKLKGSLIIIRNENST